MRTMSLFKISTLSSCEVTSSFYELGSELLTGIDTARLWVLDFPASRIVEINCSLSCSFHGIFLTAAQTKTVSIQISHRYLQLKASPPNTCPPLHAILLPKTAIWEFLNLSLFLKLILSVIYCY